MDQEIFVTLKDVYGVRKVYPACEKSRLFADIAGTTTLTDQNIARIKALGYTVTVRPAVTNPGAL